MLRKLLKLGRKINEGLISLNYGMEWVELGFELWNGLNKDLVGILRAKKYMYRVVF